MKRLFLALVFLNVSLGFSDDAYKPPIGPRISILEASRSAIIKLRLTNTSKKPIRLFDDGNSWGAMDWRILRIRDGQAETFYQSPYQLFSKNTPTSYELVPGKYRDLKLDVNGGNWCGRGHCSWWDEKGLGGQKVSFTKGDQIVVVYEAPISDESQKYHVFSGVVAASTIVQ